MENFQEQAIQPQDNQPHYPVSKPNKKRIYFVALIVVLVIAVAGVGYAFIKYALIKETVLSSDPPYSEKNLLSGIAASISKINYASYIASINFDMGPRDTDAEPFATKITNVAEFKKQYKNDIERTNSIFQMRDMLRMYYKKYNFYPKSLQPYLENERIQQYFKDPASQKPYDYSPNKSGKDYTITVVFETDSAIASLKKNNDFLEATTLINGKTVTFTNKGVEYFSLPAQPEPFLTDLSSSISRISPKTKVSATVSAQSNSKNKELSDWKFQANAILEDDDETFKFDIDVVRKNQEYYFKINSFPDSFFGFIFNIEKGQWIKFNSGDASGLSSYPYFAKNLPEVVKEYDENKKEIVSFIKKAIKIADEEGLIGLKNSVRQEKINGQDSYRYDLEIKKSAIIPFYRRFMEETDKSIIKELFPFSASQKDLDYLESLEFSEFFDYYQKNTLLTLWVDSRGFPIIASYKMRVVPPDSAEQLKEKQGNLVLKLELSDVNKSVRIEAPADYKDLKDILNKQAK